MPPFSGGSAAANAVTMITLGLLIVSNIFMTFAWYWQLRFPHWSIPVAIMVGWSIALLEYCFAVPANRIGYGHQTTHSSSEHSSTYTGPGVHGFLHPLPPGHG